MASRDVPRAANHADTETLEVRSGGPRAASIGARLVVVHPLDLACEIPVIAGSGALELGRDAIPHSTVSRRHLVIDTRAGIQHASDPGSKNGAWLDGVWLGPTPRPLTDGAVLRLGGVVLVYEQTSALPAASITAPVIAPTSALPNLFDAVPGQSFAARHLRDLITRASKDPSPVLVLGETGVGKERVAKVLHSSSGRPGAFVAVNVAELSERLIESQLFGHVKGAFTGAESAQPGLFRAARRGTLLLDEIGELSVELQAKLLRVLQEREVRPVGATRAESIDVRVIAATHRDLATDVDAGRFRRDLWARLRLWELRVPPLSARRSDILELTQRLYTRYLADRSLAPRTLHFEPEAVEALLLAPHRENLRSLDRLAHALGPTPRSVLSLADIQHHLDPRLPTASPRPDLTPSPTEPAPSAPRSADELRQALATHGSVRGLAKYYGKDRRQIYRWLNQFGLRDAESSPDEPEGNP
jgi:DNA-binding NtrC family response regulator